MKDGWPRPVPALSLTVEEASLLARPLPGSPAVAAVTAVAGGLANTTLRLDFIGGDGPGGPPPLVARLYQRDGDALGRERALHTLVAARGVPVPRLWFAAADNPVTGTPYALMDWVEGVRPDRVDDPPPALGAALGRTLAAIHAVTFGQTGFLDAAVRVVRPLDMGGAGLVAFLRRCLVDGTGGTVLGDELTAAVLRVAEAGMPLLAGWGGPPCLAHGDFGGSNLLVRREGDGWAVAAVLDWEFAFAGTPFFDLGNLLRPPLGERPGFAEAVAAGYRAAGGRLPERWREMAELVDLTAWADFVSRPVVPPAVAASARRLFQRSIARLSPGPPLLPP